MEKSIVEISCKEVFQEISSYIDEDVELELKARGASLQEVPSLQSCARWHAQYRAPADG